MPAIDPDAHDDDGEDWQTAADRHFLGDWQADAARRPGPRTRRRPFSRSLAPNTTTTKTGTTPENTEH